MFESWSGVEQHINEYDVPLKVEKEKVKSYNART